MIGIGIHCLFKWRRAALFGRLGSGSQRKTNIYPDAV